MKIHSPLKKISTTEAKGNWNEQKGKLKQKFANLTDDDLMFFLNNMHSAVLSTMKFPCIAINIYLVKSERKTVLKMPAKDKGKQFLKEMFQNGSDLSPPFSISNA